MIEKIKINYKKILFFSFLLIYFILGFLVTYNYDITSKYDFIFEADLPRILADFCDIFGNHHRISVHPIYIILLQPVINLSIGITHNKILGIILIQSIAGATQVFLMNEILLLLNKNKKTSLLISLIFGLSATSTVFASTPEVYVFASTSLLYLWYILIKKLKNKINSKQFNILFTICGILSLGLTITNYIIFLIISFILLLNNESIKKIILINIIVIISTISLNYIQNLVWNNTPTIFETNTIKKEAGSTWVDFNINSQKIKNVISDGYYNSILASNVYLTNTPNTNKTLIFHTVPKYTLVLLTIFYITTIILLIKNYKDNKLINLGLSLSIIFNTIFHLIYGNNSVFLYSSHFLYLIFLILGININKKSNKINILLTLLIISEIVLNTKLFKNIIELASTLFKSNYYASVNTYTLIIILILLYLSIFIVYFIISKILKYIKIKDNHIILIKYLLTILYISLIFTSIISCTKYDKLIGFDIIKTKIIDKEYSSFSKYKKEINSYKLYKKEYKEFIKNSQAKTISINEENNIYFFGFNNRKKLLYKDGILKDLKTNKILYKFNVNKELIIPNIYTVLIELKNGKTIKIYENEKGIFIDNDKTITIDDNKVNLPNLNKYQYGTLLNTLYGEILFNIKDGVIYPNILVYDKPWYRDAAITGMVLELTNNTSIIEKWINSIENIYDYQNKGTKETDNLGELLYLASLTKNRNTKLITNIQKETEKIIKNNKNGNYLIGLTDYSEKNYYPSAWYNFGLTKLGLKEILNLKQIKNKDDYSITTWWYNNNCNFKEKINTDYNFPYLAYAQNHCTNKTEIYLNKNLYPLSWEKNASEAKYDKMLLVDDIYKEEKLSITHTWSASELFMLIVEKYN